MSESHKDFIPFVGNWSYLLHYDLWLQQISCLHSLTVPIIPYSVMRRSLFLPTVSSDESVISTDLRPRKAKGVKEDANEVVILLAAEDGKGSSDQINIMKQLNEQYAKQVEQNQKVLAIPDTIHTIREEINLARKEIDLVQKEMDSSKLVRIMIIKF